MVIDKSHTMKKQFFAILITLISFSASAQNFGLGGSIMYNFQSEGFGLGVRGNIFPNSKLSYVPQIAYYPGIGFSDIKVREYIFGLGLEYKLIQGNRLTYYLIAHGGYNSWSNPEESSLENAQTANWNIDLGGGITTNTCLRPFLEYRYNIKFQETHLQFGLLYIFGCNDGGNGYRDTRRVRNASSCTGF